MDEAQRQEMTKVNLSHALGIVTSTLEFANTLSAGLADSVLRRSVLARIQQSLASVQKRQAAARLQITVLVAHRGKLPAVKVGRAWRVDPQILEAWITERSLKNIGARR